MELVLLLLALIGHGYLWAAFFNHTHSTALPRWIISPSTAVGFACTLLIPVAFFLWFPRSELGVLGLDDAPPAVWLGRLYLGVSLAAGVVTTLRWAWRRLLRRPPDVLRYDRARPCGRLRPPGPLSPGEGDHHFLLHLPGNEILQLEVAERAIEVPQLPEALDRLVIVHLSDLHFTGRVGKAYFEQVVRTSNKLEPDLVAITGDLTDFSQCIDWIPDTLGRLTSRYGAYFVLGNHDVWVDTDRLRRTLADSGLVDLGSRWTEARIRGEPVILAGNELPWILPAADLEHAPPRSADGGPLRIVLTHCPDQLSWARANDVDLLLAGHTHGGQIRIPLVGPLLSASRLGVAYSSGTFYRPPTIMHVTRGISGRHPVRFNCPPELVKLVLRTALPPRA
jgi:predicted MPP superfamily phosphohydrolase